MATDPSLRSACLTDALRLVRSRIESDGAYIAGHETRTRQFLIDPVLTALGWTVLDPALVILEAPAQGGRADYSLHERQYSVLVVDAKRLGSSLLGEPVDQATTYGHWARFRVCRCYRRRLLAHVRDQGVSLFGCFFVDACSYQRCER